MCKTYSRPKTIANLGRPTKAKTCTNRMLVEKFDVMLIIYETFRLNVWLNINLFDMAPFQAVQKWLTLAGYCFANFSNAIGFGLYFTNLNAFSVYYDVY